MKLARILFALLFVGGVAFAYGCDDDDDIDSAEEAGEKVDEAVDDAGDAAEEAGDDMKHATDEAADDIDDATDDAAGNP